MRLRTLTALAALALAACGGDSTSEPVTRTGEAVTVCPTTVVEGVDVSDWDGTIDWDQVAASGRAFAFIKATQGNYDAQSTFAASWSGAKAAGLLRSPYHFFDATVDGVTQAQYFLSILNAQGGLEPGDLPPMLDIECPTSSSESGAERSCEGQGYSGWVPPATLAQVAFDWLTTVEQATGRTPIIYSYPDWFESVGFTDPRLAQYALYIASPFACADVPAPWTTTVFWQYSSKAIVPGIGGNGSTDVDRFLGTQAQLTALATGGGVDAAASDASHEGEMAPLPSDAAGTDDTARADGAIEAESGASPGSGGSRGGCGCALAARPRGPTGGGTLGLATALALARRRRERSHPVLRS